MTDSPRNVWIYFGLTYAITWGLLGPWVYLYHHHMAGEFPWWFILMGMTGGYGPTIAALTITAYLQHRDGIRRLLSKLLIWRVDLRWYAFVAFSPVLVLLLAVLIFTLSGGNVGQFEPTELCLTFLPTLLFALPFGPVAEELGWRGFALPKLQEMYSPLRSSIILGTIWTFWHLPMFWFPGAALSSATEIGLASISLYLVHTIVQAILFTWVFNHTKGSVLVAILFHGFSNASGSVVEAAFPDISAEQMLTIDAIDIALESILAFVIVTAFGLGEPSSSLLSDSKQKPE